MDAKKPDVEQGIFGLVGVALGVLLGSVMSLVERGQRTSVEARRALRLLDAEFASAQWRIGRLLVRDPEGVKATAVQWVGRYRTEAWEQERNLVATLPMSEADWDAIRRAGNWIGNLNRLNADEVQRGSADDFTEYIRDAKAYVAEGRAALARLRPSPSPEVLTLMAGRG